MTFLGFMFIGFLQYFCKLTLCVGAGPLDDPDLYSGHAHGLLSSDHAASLPAATPGRHVMDELNECLNA